MTRKSITILFTLAAQISLLPPCGVAAVQSTAGAEAQLRDDNPGRDWAGYGRTHNENHYSPLRQISLSSVSRLSLAWSFELDNFQRADSQPVEADGIVYVSTGQSIVRALDAHTGALKWVYDSEAAQRAGDKLRASWGTRGLATWNDKVYVATHDGRLVVLAAATGKPVWTAQVVPKDDETTITGAPRLFRNRVVVGFAGGDHPGTRGAVTCYDAETGRQLWRFFTVPGNPALGFENQAMRMAAETWSGKWWETGGGGAVWNAMAYDEARDRLYIGTGNANPWNPAVRNPTGGDNLFTASIVALDAATGRYLWHYQETPNDAWDYDSTMDIELARLDLHGRSVDVLLHAPKNGFLYVIDRDNGKLLSADKLGKVTWAERVDLSTGRPVEAPGVRYAKEPILLWPSYNGIHNWPPMSFNPETHVLYIPTINQPAYYNTESVDIQHWKPLTNSWTTALGDVDRNVPTSELSGSLLAWDPVSQRELWRRPTAGLWSGGTMATGGGLVFQGQIDGTFDAYDAATGQNVWRFDAGSAVLGAPISYLVDEKQYITVLAGPPAATASYSPDSLRFGWRYRQSPRRVMTFALDGTATLPPPAPAAPVASPHSTEPLEAAQAQAGAILFAYHCSGCHGRAATPAGGSPDLRASEIAFSSEALTKVLQGALVGRGMPRFSEFSALQIEQLRSYIRQRAQESSPAAAR